MKIASDNSTASGREVRGSPYQAKFLFIRGPCVSAARGPRKKWMLGFMLMVCLIRGGVVGAEPRAIMDVLPTEESLGKHWKREVQLLFDPLSEPPEIASTAPALPESFRVEQFDGVRNPQGDVSGWSHVQYTVHTTNGPAAFDVQIERYRDRQRLADAFDELFRIDSEQYQQSPVTGLGDAALFYRNTEGDGSTVWFRSGDFKVWISPSRRVTSWEQDVNLQRVAVQLDRRIHQGIIPLTGESRSGKYKTAIILGTWAWDVGSNSLGDLSRSDFWWKREAKGYLVPLRGAKAAIVEEPDFDAIDADTTRRVELSEQEIPGDDLKPGVAVVFRTAKGKYGKLQVLGYKALHDFRFSQAAHLSEDWKAHALSKPDLDRFV